MPPKRTAAASSSPQAETPPPRSKRSRGPMPTTKSAQKMTGFPVAEYEPKALSPEFTWIQRHTCQKWSSSDGPEKCMSCIEKQSHCGSCRFVNLRAFREKPDYKGVMRQDWSDYCFRSNLDDDPLPVVAPRGAGLKKAAAKKEERRPERKEIEEFGNRRASRRSTRRSSGMDIDEPETPTEPARSVPAEEEDPEELEVLGVHGKDPKVFASPPMKANKEHGDYALPLISKTFASYLEVELGHEALNVTFDKPDANENSRPLIRVQNSPAAKTTCDMCAASIFMGSYMCGCCGREFCLSCWKEWEPSDTIDNRWPLPRDKCSRRRRHVRSNFIFVTRAGENEVVEFLREVQAVSPRIKNLEDEKIVDSIQKLRATSWKGVDGPMFLGVPRAQYSDVPLEKFQALWRLGGVPLVLQGMIERFRLPWDPDYMIRHYGNEECVIHDCMDGSTQPAKVKTFFEAFSSGFGQSYKLKDWPPQANFKDTFPELFTDFENAVPYPEYTRRSGPLNLASFFPAEANAPDLGPKMYNAYPSPDFLPAPEGEDEESLKLRVEDVKGTTNLHLDLTDAVNIMLHATGGNNAPDEATIAKAIPKCGAIWDIFRPTDATAIREYLSERYAEDNTDDPIHRQLYYLSEIDLVSLRDKGIMAYRIYQNPGEAVFIPAGCPHQVRNRMNCIKVAVDFLSPENVPVCKYLLEEGRAMAPKDNRARAREMMKDDVLQLWEACRLSWKALKVASPGPPRPPPPPPRPKNAPAPIAPMGLGWRITTTSPAPAPVRPANAPTPTPTHASPPIANGASPPPLPPPPPPPVTNMNSTPTPTSDPTTQQQISLDPRKRPSPAVTIPLPIASPAPGTSMSPSSASSSAMKRKYDKTDIPSGPEPIPAEKRPRACSEASVKVDNGKRCNGSKDMGWPKNHRMLLNPYCTELK